MVDRHTEGGRYVRVDGWMDGCMDGEIDRCMHA